MSTETENKKLLTLISNDSQKFEIDEAVALQSQTIKHMVEDDCANNAIPLTNVSSKILVKVIQYLKKHAEDKETNNKEHEESIKKFDADFAKDQDKEALSKLIVAANYLDIKGLMNLMCQTAADMIRDMSVEEVREVFNIQCDYTPEEEDELRKENSWAFEQQSSSS